MRCPIGRIGLMTKRLGRPEVDPHGDPIPDCHGALPAHERSPAHSALGVPLIIVL